MLLFTFNFHPILIWCSSSIIYKIRVSFSGQFCNQYYQYELMLSSKGKISNLLRAWQYKPLLCHHELDSDTWLKTLTSLFGTASTPGCAMVIFNKFFKHRLSFIQCWGNMAGLNMFAEKWNHGPVSIILIVKHLFRSIFLQELFFSNFL